MAQCGMWHRMEKIIPLKNGEQNEHDDICEGKALYKEDKRAIAPRAEEFGGLGHVQVRLISLRRERLHR